MGPIDRRTRFSYHSLVTLKTELSVLVFAALVVLGCKSIAEKIVEKPKVALSSLALKDVGPNGATLVFGVEVENPNPFALKLDALHYDLELGGRAIGSGQIEKPSEVAAHAKGVVDVPVPVKFADLFSSLSEFLTKTTTRYRVKGEASFGMLVVPFDEKGDLKLK